METLRFSAAEWLDQARAAHDSGWWLADLCGVDRLGLRGEGERFEVVVQLLHHEGTRRAMVHVPAEGDPPTLPSVVDVWPSANFFEREAYDMFGIHFDGHPNLSRILMPDEWEGHPLRKDYGTGKVPVEFVEQPFVQLSPVGQSPKPEEAGLSIDEIGTAAVTPQASTEETES